MTIKLAKARLSFYSMVLRKVDGEYQVKRKGAPWDGAATYFTNDLADAVASGIAIAASEA